MAEDWQSLHHDLNEWATARYAEWREERESGSAMPGLATTRVVPARKPRKEYEPAPLPAGTPPLPKQAFQVILSDPPWQYENFKTKSAAGKKYGAASAEYSTMSVPELMSLDVGSIADEQACAHYMWTTTTHIHSAWQLLEWYGFEYRNIAFTWIKTDKGGKPVCGMGYNTRQSAEFVVLGVKRKMPTRLDASVNSTILAPRPLRGHSAKPDEIYDRIFRLHGDIPRVELFARSSADGWVPWGNQAPDVG